MNYYELNLCGIKRNLPIIEVSKNLDIASFVLLGDQEICTLSAKNLSEKMPEVDLLVTAEAKGIPLVNEIARLKNMPKYVVARKSVKVYMDDPLSVEVDSITTANIQKLYLAKEDAILLKGKKIALVDDVISTGQSIGALEELVKKAGGNVVARVAILAEGDAANRQDIIFLEKLPIFPK